MFATISRQRDTRFSWSPTFPHYPQWKVRKEYAGQFISERGSAKFRCGEYGIIFRSGPARSNAFFTTAVLPQERFSRPGLRGVRTWCLRDAAAGTGSFRIRAGAFLGVPFVLWIKDLVPDVAIQLGMLKNPLAIALARTLERFAYHRAAKLFVLSEGFADNIIRQGIPNRKFEVVSDWVNTESIRPEYSGKAFREKMASIPPRLWSCTPETSETNSGSSC